MSSRDAITVLLLLAALTVGCGPSAAEQAAEAQRQYELQQAQIEEQKRLAEEKAQGADQLEQLRRGFIGVEFAGFDGAGRITLTLSNLTDRGIDDVRGGIQALDSKGNELAATGYTEEVPGDVFLEVGASRTLSPFVREKPELADRLRSDAAGVTFVFEARVLTWADGTVEAGLGDPAS